MFALIRSTNTAIILSGVLILALVHTMPAYAATFEVNTTDDLDDGLCDATHCSLREAINAANASAGPDTISFNIPGVGPHTIVVASQLPAATDGATTIDATTQPGYSGSPLIVIQPGSSGASVSGIVLESGDNIVRGLSVVGFDGPLGIANGILVSAGSGNLIEENYIGITPALSALGNRIGIFLDASTQVVQNNVISGNLNIGVSIFPGSASNLIIGNMIGTDPTGTGAIGNDVGVFIGGTHNGIGQPGNGNVISGNSIGIAIDLAQFNLDGINVITGNMIGTDVSGSSPIPNGRGVFNFNGFGVIIGGFNPGEGNLVAFNTLYGIGLQGDQHYVMGNEIHDNANHGVYVNGKSLINENSMYDNGGLGIRIAYDGGPGEPVLLSLSGGVLTGTACPGCEVEIFAVDADPSGGGEGKTFLESVRADDSGNFSASMPTSVIGCAKITATASEGLINGTSQFSQNISAGPCVDLEIWAIPFLIGGGVLIGIAVGGFVGRDRPANINRYLAAGGIGGLTISAALVGGLLLTPFVNFDQPQVPRNLPPDGDLEVLQLAIVESEGVVEEDTEPAQTATELPLDADTPTPTFTATFTPTASPIPTETLVPSDTPTATATVVQVGSISGVVWEDVNGNGVFDDGGSAGIAGVEVTLVSGGSCAGIAITTNTDSSGNYSFNGVSPGQKCITARNGTGGLSPATSWDPTQPDFPMGGNASYQITLSPGENLNLPFGFDLVAAP